jgi:hypothetical protein
MDHFPLPLIGELKENGTLIELEAPFAFVDDDYIIAVPAGFVCNFNSVPRGFWNIFPPWKYPEAGVVHDYLYRYNGLTRKEADLIHRRILELKGCPWWLRHTAYAALRLFGGRTWDTYRTQE